MDHINVMKINNRYSKMKCLLLLTHNYVHIDTIIMYTVRITIILL